MSDRRYCVPVWLYTVAVVLSFVPFWACLVFASIERYCNRECLAVERNWMYGTTLSSAAAIALLGIVVQNVWLRHVRFDQKMAEQTRLKVQVYARSLRRKLAAAAVSASFAASICCVCRINQDIKSLDAAGVRNAAGPLWRVVLEALALIACLVCGLVSVRLPKASVEN